MNSSSVQSFGHSHSHKKTYSHKLSSIAAKEINPSETESTRQLARTKARRESISSASDHSGDGHGNSTVVQGGSPGEAEANATPDVPESSGALGGLRGIFVSKETRIDIS